MNISYSPSSDIELLECIDKIHDIYRVRWNIIKINNSLYSFYEEDFNHLPSIDEIKETILKYYNNIIKNKIENEFYWNNIKFYFPLFKVF